MKRAVELRNQLQALSKEATVLTSKTELEVGDTTRILELDTEIDNVRALLDTELAAERKVAELRGKAADTSRFLTQPGYNEPGSGEPTPGRENESRQTKNPGVIHYAPSGETYLRELKDGGVEITSTGHGLLSRSQYAKIDSSSYGDAFMDYLQSGGDFRRMSDVNVRAIQEGLDDQGGYLVPPEMALKMIQRKPTPTALSPHYFAWQTSRDAVIFPKVQYTGATDDPNAILYTTGVRVVYPGEIPNDQNTTNVTQPAFGETRIPVYTAMMSIDVSRNMIDDSPIGILNFIESKLQETAGLEYDNRSINGTGVNQASGILMAPQVNAYDTTNPQYIPMGSASALTSDGIKALLFGIAPQYLDNCRFAMNWTNTAQAISDLKDGQGRYLWSQGNQDNGLSVSMFNRPLLGLPVSYSQFIPNIAANAFPIVFGDLGGYYLVQRLGLSIQILFETKAKQNMLEVVARMRFGGQVAEPWRIKVAKVSIT